MRRRMLALGSIAVLAGIGALAPAGAGADPAGICPDGMMLFPATTNGDVQKDGTRDGTGTGDGFVCKKPDPTNPTQPMTDGSDENNVIDNLPL